MNHLLIEEPRVNRIALHARLIIGLSLLLLCLPVVSWTQPRSVRAIPLASQITVDGLLTEDEWTQPGFTAFLQRDPVEGGTPSMRTEVWVAYDHDALFVAAKMYDSAPDSIVRRLSRRDALWSSDIFYFYIDPYHDRQTGYYFAVDAAGTLYDGTLYNDDWNDDSWDGVWEGKAHVDSAGWTVEMRIPFSQIRFRMSDSAVWGIDYRREIARRTESIYAAFTPKNGSGFVSRFLDLVGLEGLGHVSRLEILPYVTTRAEFLQHPPGDPFHTSGRYVPGIGADIKYGLGPNLTLDGTINPDFGQVEVDPAVVNLSDVETIFNEKRPFFLEGANIFSFGRGGANSNWGFNWGDPNSFYARRIGRTPHGSIPDGHSSDVPTGTRIIGAAKLSGKVDGDVSLGAINAVTAREFADLDSSGRRSSLEVEPLTYYGVFRARKEFNDSRQSIGMIGTVTARGFLDPRLKDEMNSNSFVGGIDGWTFFDTSKTWVLTGWTMMSGLRGNTTHLISLQRNSQHYFQRPDARSYAVDSAATSLTGWAGRLFLNRQKGDLQANAAVGIISPKFDNNDLGFLWRTDIINSHAMIGYSWVTPTGWYRDFQVNAAAFRTYDFDGDITWEGVFALAQWDLLNFMSLRLDYAYNPQTVDTRRTRGGPRTLNAPGYQVDAMFSTDNRKETVFNVNGMIYRDRFLTWNLFATLEWRPATNISVSIGPGFEHNADYGQYVGTFTDPLATATFGNRYVLADLSLTTISANIRLNWTFTPSLSLQLYMQPLASTAHYTHFKELARPRSLDFLVYGTDGSTLAVTGTAITADPDGPGPVGPLAFTDPSFSLVSFRGNAVLRWEYLPGSTLYVVWTQSRSDDEPWSDPPFNHSIHRMLDAHPDNIFLVKLAYWLGL